MNSEVAKEQLESTDPWRRGVTRNVGDSVLYHALRRQAPSRLLRHLSEKSAFQKCDLGPTIANAHIEPNSELGRGLQGRGRGCDMGAIMITKSSSGR